MLEYCQRQAKDSPELNPQSVSLGPNYRQIWNRATALNLIIGFEPGRTSHGNENNVVRTDWDTHHGTKLKQLQPTCHNPDKRKSKRSQ